MNEGEQVKIVTFVPVSHAGAVRQAMGEAGAGRINNYTFCSFSSRGTGQFLPGGDAHLRIWKSADWK